MSATLPIAATPCAPLPRNTQPEPRAFAINHAPAPAASFTSIVTLVLWTGCLLVGVLGLLPRHTSPQPAPEPPPLIAEKITVQLTHTAPSPIATPPPATTPTTPSITPPLAPLVAVAAPSPALAFILPVAGPVRLVAANQAAYAHPAGLDALPERHLWGPRDNFKSDYYRLSPAHFASELGYHGCPAPESVARFISPEKLWPPENDEWLLHSTSPVPGVNLHDYRVELMRKQVRELFGVVPDNLADFAFASQAVQAEALKFFIEHFRSGKWRRTGIVWWNLRDGWPQFSDAIIDYYGVAKRAFAVVRRSQAPLCLVFREPRDWAIELVACNDTRDDLPLTWQVSDVSTGTVVLSGESRALRDAVTSLGRVPFTAAQKTCYHLTWTSPLGSGENHYLAGHTPHSLTHYRDYLRTLGWLGEGAH